VKNDSAPWAPGLKECGDLLILYQINLQSIRETSAGVYPQ